MIEAELDARKKAFEDLRNLDPGEMTPEGKAALQAVSRYPVVAPDVDYSCQHATTSPMPDGIEWLGGIYIDGTHRPYPPVPEGYDHWEYRGKCWADNRPAKYGFWTSGGEWFVYSDDPSAPCGCDIHYIEAVKKDPANFDPIEIGDEVLVKMVRDENSRVEVVTNIRDIRGEIVYEFANSQSVASSDIYSITRLP